jgi:glycosyltransferase involved in cell wall biosynthesis
MLSIVIPIHNEEPSILPLYDRLTAVLEPLHRPYEILLVDDASTDRSFELLANLVETDGHLKVIRLRRNFGQTAALSAGFHEAKGDVVIAMDGDLQHAPEDIPALLAKIDEGYDIAGGWRQHQQNRDRQPPDALVKRPGPRNLEWDTVHRLQPTNIHRPSGAAGRFHWTRHPQTRYTSRRLCPDGSPFGPAA